MRTQIVLALLLIAGCSSESPPQPADPASDRLSAGQMVIVATKHQDEMVSVEPPAGGKFVRGEAGFHVGVLYAGDTAQVVTDEDPAGTNRRVTVKVATAKFSSKEAAKYDLSGTVCTVPREVLRAMKRE